MGEFDLKLWDLGIFSDFFTFFYFFTLIYTDNTFNDYDIKLGAFLIPRVNVAKLLGIYLDHQLKWDSHTKSIANRLSKLSGVLYLCRNKLPNECLKAIYHSLAYSHLSYGVTIWGGTWANHLRCVLIAQKRILRVISYASRYDRSLPLFIRNNLLSFKYIHIYFSSLMMFKFLNHNYCADLFRAHIIVRNLRNIANTVHVPFFRTVRGQKSLFYLCPKTWNTLPNDLRCIGNINTFKSRLKTYLFNVQSSLIIN